MRGYSSKLLSSVTVTGFRAPPESFRRQALGFHARGR